MTIRSLMTQKATILRRLGPPQKGEFGEDLRPFALLAAGVPCLAQHTRAMEAVTARQMGVVDELFNVWMPLGTDIAEADVISEVHDRTGFLLAKNLDITAVHQVAGNGGIVNHVFCTAIQTRSNDALSNLLGPTPVEEPNT